MDRRADWPWSWEEEVEWKADLEERDYDFLAGLIDGAVENGTTDSFYILGPVHEEESVEDAKQEEYSVAA
jgi:hypothetical protein